jgi:hypothetical protein
MSSEMTRQEPDFTKKKFEVQDIATNAQSGFDDLKQSARFGLLQVRGARFFL